MTIKAINSYDDNGMLSTVVTSSAVGAGLGYTSKYLLPITEQERDANYKKIVKIARSEAINSKKDAIDEIRNVKKKSLAQDTFIKMIDNKEKINTKTIKSKIKQLGGPESVDAMEFRNIIANINESAAKLSKQCISIYEGVIKRIRPTSPFVVVGAIAGLFAGVTQNVFKSNNAA